MRIALITLGCVLISISSFSQDSTKFRKFYIEIGGGYNFPIVNDELQSPREQVGTLDHLMREDSSLSVRPVQGTLGSGWKSSVNVGYMFHPNIGIEFQFNYVRGEDILMSRINTPTYNAEHSLLSQRVEATPQLVLNHQMKRWGIYSKSGVIIPLWGYVESTITVDDQEGRAVEGILGYPVAGLQAKVNAQARSNPRFSYGFQTRLGVSFQASNLISIYAEAHYAALSIRAKETITEEMDIELTNVNGGTPLFITADDLDAIEINSNYVDEITETSNNPLYNPNVDLDKPLDEPAFKDNFNSVGVSIGVRFNIW